MNIFDIKRRFYNERIIWLLWRILHGRGRNLRFCQLLYILNEQKDYFNEEPKETLVRMKKIIEKL